MPVAALQVMEGEREAPIRARTEDMCDLNPGETGGPAVLEMQI